MVGFLYPKSCGERHTLVLSAHSYNLHAKNLQNPLTLVAFVTLSTLAVPADREEENNTNQAQKFMGNASEWVPGSEDKEWGESKKVRSNRDRL